MKKINLVKKNKINLKKNLKVSKNYVKQLNSKYNLVKKVNKSNSIATIDLMLNNQDNCNFNCDNCLASVIDGYCQTYYL